jgi:phage terminase large subunit-like protein
MGLRGPGAKPIRKAAGDVPEGPRDPHPWEAPGLSRAERVIAFIETLPITSGTLAGQRFKLRPWQKRFLKAVYATGRDGRRKVRTAVLCLARKQGKTALAAAIALAHLCGPESEERGEVYSAANDRFQASRLHKEMVAIIERTPWMAERVSIVRHSKELEDIGGTGSTFAALSADVGTKHGLSPSCVVYDELGQALSRELFDVLDTAMGARAEPLILVISTQAASETAPMSELVDYGLRVQRGEVKDASFHLTLYAAPEDADPWDEKTWRLANPALGDFRSIEDVRRLAAQAQRMPSREASFRNLILNQRIDATAGFMSRAVWTACAGAVDLEALKGRPCFAGLDLGATRDLTALILAFADEDGGFDVVPFFFLPGDGLRDREDRDRVPYCAWRDAGHLIALPGKTTDPRAVAAKIAELHGRFAIKALAFDRWRIEDLRRELDALGCDVALVAHGQGFRDMSPAIDVLERLAVEGQMRHGMHPVLTWCMANARVTADPAGNRKLDKGKSTGRIDGAVALAMAFAVAARHAPEAPWEPLAVWV